MNKRNACLSEYAGWNALDCLSAEVFPTQARAGGMGFVCACGRCGAIAGQFANGALSKRVPLLLAATSGVTLLGAAAALLLPPDGNSADGDRDADGSDSIWKCLQFRRWRQHASVVTDGVP